MNDTRITDRQKHLREEYLARINKVVDHIANHLHEDLSLEVLARVANFSPYHFHRIFGAMVGETLNRFIGRLRVEKASLQLIYNPKKSVTEVAYDCGYSSSAAFARAFKDAFGMSATQWRTGGYQEYSKNRKAKNNNGQKVGKMRKDFDLPAMYIDPVTNHPRWEVTMQDESKAQVEVQDVTEMHIAYIRHIGPYAGDAELFRGLFEQLMRWAGPRGLLRFPETKVMAIYHDDPKITDPEKLRTDCCITVPSDTEVDGEIGKAAIPAGLTAMAKFELAADEYEGAWNFVYGQWLPQSGYQPDDRPCYELYHNNPDEHPEGKCIVSICVPVRPL
jgi:AraC family transcriptional regulator